jgi:hypothetical protein
MKLVYESLNEFDRGRDPIEAMGIGLSPEEKLKIKQKVPVLKRESPYLGKNKHGNKVYSRGYTLWKLLDYIGKAEDTGGRSYTQIVKFYYSDNQKTLGMGVFNSVGRYTKGWKQSYNKDRRFREKNGEKYFLNDAGWKYWEKYRLVFNSIRESINFERGQEPFRAMRIGNPIISIQLDTASVNIKNDEFVKDADSEFLLDIIKKNKIRYKIINTNIAIPWPIIEYTGTKKQLIPLLTLFDAHGREEQEVEKALENWYGDEDELTEILF